MKFIIKTSLKIIVCHKWFRVLINSIALKMPVATVATIQLDLTTKLTPLKNWTKCGTKSKLLDWNRTCFENWTKSEILLQTQ